MNLGRLFESETSGAPDYKNEKKKKEARPIPKEMDRAIELHVSGFCQWGAEVVLLDLRSERGFGARTKV